MRNKLTRIVSENNNVFLKDYKSISGFKKLKSAFMSILDGLFFYSTILIALYLSALLMNNPDSILLKAIMLSLCILLVFMPTIVIQFDKYSTIKKMTFFKGIKSVYKQRIMNNELSLKSLEILSNNLEKEEMEIIFNKHKKIHFNVVYFEELLKEKEELSEKKEEIKKWLNKYQIRDFIINDDLTIDVNNSVHLQNEEIEEFPFQFGIITGYFDCSRNNLKSLKNAPKRVEEYFDCSNNKLISLENCPEKVNGNFNCSYNNLTSLEYAPEEITGSFYCYNNRLESLKYCPKKIDGIFDCSHNKLTSLKYSPKEVNGVFDCSHNNLTSLEYCPEQINSNFDCSNNKLKKELLYVFNSNIVGRIFSDFGNKELFSDYRNKEEFLKMVMLFKNIQKEKTKINKILMPQKNGPLTKKRL